MKKIILILITTALFMGCGDDTSTTAGSITEAQINDIIRQYDEKKQNFKLHEIADQIADSSDEIEQENGLLYLEGLSVQLELVQLTIDNQDGKTIYNLMIENDKADKHFDFVYSPDIEYENGLNVEEVK